MPVLKRYNGTSAEPVGGPINDAYLVTFAREGDVDVSVGKGLWMPPHNIEILGLSAAVVTAPSGASLNIAFENDSGVDYATTSIPSGSTEVLEGSETISTATVAGGTRMRIAITQVGSTTAGADLSVFVRYRRA